MLITMNAMILYEQKPVEDFPLIYEEIDDPIPTSNQVLIKIEYCGVCRTDLHIVEGELSIPRLPIIVGHQIVGRVESVGRNVAKIVEGDIVGVPWLYWSCGKCRFCKHGLENLCDYGIFTGYSVNGGYAEYMVAYEDFVHKIPKEMNNVNTPPLLCGGAIGYRALKMTGLLEKGEGRLGLFGFGSSAHMVIQVALNRGLDVYVFTRSKERQRHALNLGAVWAGSPREGEDIRLDAAIVFAPAGWVAIEALKRLDKAGRVVLAGIYMTPIEKLDYRYLWLEHEIKSVANITRRDVREFLEIAFKIGLKTTIEKYSLKDANKALYDLKYGNIKGSIVLKL